MCSNVGGRHTGKSHYLKTKNFVVRIFKWLLRSSESSEPPLNDVSAFSLILVVQTFNTIFSLKCITLSCPLFDLVVSICSGIVENGIYFIFSSDKTAHFPFGVLSFGKIESDKENHDDVRSERENRTHTTIWEQWQQ